MSADEQLIADHLLGELDAAGVAEVERRAAADPAFAARIEAMRPVVEALEALPPDAWDPPAPPPLPVLEGPAPGHRARGVLVAAVLVLLLVVAGASWWALAGRDEGGANGPAIALAPVGTSDPAARGEAHTARGGAALALDVSGMPESAPGTSYELWLLDGPERLLSLGTFRVPASGDASLEVPLPVPVTDFAYVDVSREPDDGDPGHSGDSLLRGASS